MSQDTQAAEPLFDSSNAPEPKPRTLFEIGEEMEYIDDLIEEAEEGIEDPAVQEAIDGWFDSISSDLEDKVDNYAGFITELEARASARKKEAKRIRKRSKRDANLAGRLSERLKEFFQEQEIKSIETPRYRVGWRNAGGRAPINIADGTNPRELEERFQNVKVKVQKSAVREALENGEALEFADFGERSSYLTIK